MDTCLGVVGKDFVLLAADAMAGRSIMVYKSDEDKVRFDSFGLTSQFLIWPSFGFYFRFFHAKTPRSSGSGQDNHWRAAFPFSFS